jgi:hypothetical protein
MAKHDPRLEKIEKLKRLHDDPAASQGERENCERAIERLVAELNAPKLDLKRSRFRTTLKQRRSERERLKRVRAGLEAPVWDDVNIDVKTCLDELDRIPLSSSEMEFLAIVRGGVADDRRYLEGSALARMNDLLKRRFNIMIKGASA